MDDPLAVRLVQRVGDLLAVAQCLLKRERSSGEAIAQRLALKVLHDQILDFALSPHVVKLADVWMGELRDRLRSPLEPLTHLGRRRQVLRQHLNRHRSLQARVACLVDLAHPARPERSKNLVGTEPGTGCQGHIGRNYKSLVALPTLRWAPVIHVARGVKLGRRLALCSSLLLLSPLTTPLRRRRALSSPPRG